MMLAIAILAWLLAAIGALVLCLLVLPLSIELRATATETIRWSVALRLFGGMGPRIALPVRTKRAEAARKEPRDKRRTRNRARRISASPGRMLRAVVRLVLEILGRFDIRRATLDLRFGCGDPGDTGALYGMLTPLVFGVPPGQTASIRIEPVFDARVFSGQAELDLTLVPARLVPPFLRFGWAVWGPER
ncbi:DUF2953 domain-containing protein [Ovoidimarina sediminis]|uniref:DUF2953 domain-containing protein n=1 Tax=Ovoidimarina sediminis TaxID=3079856 RepID=UPI0029116FED|nr:DUF2953 domain-containing protein [Rhodophyticola sp. MJ-SS7]MDU8943749.1 DUF2953 domain-containing protein [Rhodophyticola sp. MJ-SS7]